MNSWRALRWHEVHRLSEKRVRELQGELLARHVREYLYPFSPHYRALFDRLGIAPDSIRSIDDLRRIPFTVKQDLIPSADQPQRFRDFILQPDPASLRAAWPLSRKLSLLLTKWTHGEAALKERLRREFYPCFMTFTTGRSAEPVPFFYSRHDLDLLHETGRRLIDVMRLDSEYRVANLFPYAPHLAFWQVVAAGFGSGTMTLSTGGGKVMGSAGDLRAIARARAQAIIGVPGYIYHLLRRGVAEGVDLSSVKVVVLGAERVPAGMKQKIQELLGLVGAKGVQVYGTYGFTEARMAFAECPSADGSSTGYHLYPDLAIFEVIDPVTGEVQPDGADGELVFTPIQGRASTVFRYRTGDRVRGGIAHGPCAHCGKRLPRISSDLWRESNVKDLQMLKLKGTLVNLEDCATILSDTREVEEWQIELRKKNDDPLEVDELHLYLALRKGADRENTTLKIRESFKGRIEVSPNRVECLALEDMLRRIGMETEMKEKRFVDARPKS